MAIPPADFVLHNSLFLIAHFHNVAIGGVVFGVMAGYNYWFPKAFGFTLNETLGKAVFWCWCIGFYLAFMPLYALGLMGATRRMQHYTDPQWQPLNQVALVGALLIFCGIALTVVQLVVSIRARNRHRDLTGDPWNGRTLEWSTSSPPPAWNFALLPQVARTDPYWAAKRDPAEMKRLMGERNYAPLHIPRNTPVGFFMAFFSFILGFALIWRIWWLAVVGLIGLGVAGLMQAWRTDGEVHVSAQEVESADRAYSAQVRTA
jgi:cytochrome o ubiquinol oxidase subunit 1